ncbi:MAG: FMN-binding protein [Candidatus Izimaplasma sp.]|nr:FMN-binding protein [Candidatus Izimaplasma bacterium]
MLDKLKIALVLVVIGALSGLAIYGVNELTEETIVQNKIDREVSYYKDLFDLDDNDVITYDTLDLDNDLDQEVVVYDSTGDVIGYIYKATDINNYGDVTVLVGITVDGIISNAVISSSTDTPTFVQTIKANYIGDFSGQEVDNIVIDGKTGATYTYNSVVNIIEAASTYYLESRGE